MANQYDLLIKQDANLAEWKGLSTHPDIANLSAAIDDKCTVTVNASGTVSAGQLVHINSDGSATAVYKNDDEIGQDSTFTDSAIRIEMEYEPTIDKIFFASDGGMRVGTLSAGVSGETIVWSSEQLYKNSRTTSHPTVKYSSVTETGVALSQRTTGPYYHYVTPFSLSGDTITWGTEAVGDGNYGSSSNIVYDSVHDLFMILVSASYVETGVALHIGYISTPGTTLTTGHDPGYFNGPMVFDEGKELVVALGSSGNCRTHTAASSGVTTVTTSDNLYQSVLDSDGFIPYDGVYDPDTEQIIWVGVSGSAAKTVVSSTETSSSITFGSLDTFENIATNGFPSVTYDTQNNKVIMIYDKTGGSTVFHIGTVNSDQSVTWGDEQLMTSDTTSVRPDITYTHSGQSAVRWYVPSTTYTNILTVGGSSLLTNHFLGVALETATDGNPVKIATLGYKVTNQTGLTTPNKYYSDDTGNLQAGAGVQEVGKASSSTDLIITG